MEAGYGVAFLADISKNPTEFAVPINERWMILISAYARTLISCGENKNTVHTQLKVILMKILISDKIILHGVLILG